LVSWLVVRSTGAGLPFAGAALVLLLVMARTSLVEFLEGAKGQRWHL
jgi:hypothetical protein